MHRETFNRLHIINEIAGLSMSVSRHVASIKKEALVHILVYFQVRFKA